MTVLGIETSCDDTAAAVLVDGHLQAHTVITQLDHDAYGGIVPEVAARLHERKIVTAVRQTLDRAGCELSGISALAVTYGPGLAGALAVGVAFAKGLSQALSVPLVGVDHMEGHLWASFLDPLQAPFSGPFLCLLVSGGHTHIWRVNAAGDYDLLGRSRDDAAGEAFDKGARLLDLGYPGGPALQAAAADGNDQKVRFPRPMAGTEHCDFSFSGLKTALLYYLRDAAPDARATDADIAASYQAAIVDCLMDRLQSAVRLSGLRQVCVAGGVSANLLLRQRLDSWSGREQIPVRYPPQEFCTDNAAMIALAGYHRLQAGQSAGMELPIVPNLSLAGRG